jgi:hypothetical protein
MRLLSEKLQVMDIRKAKVAGRDGARVEEIDKRRESNQKEKTVLHLYNRI